MLFFYAFFLQSLSLAELSPALIETVKMLSVTIVWVGSLTIFMWRKEKHRNMVLAKAQRAY